MDIDKLIERLKKASADGSWNTLADYAHKAATALSTLQAENKRLNKIVCSIPTTPDSGRTVSQYDKEMSMCAYLDDLEAENEKLRAELELKHNQQTTIAEVTAACALAELRAYKEIGNLDYFKRLAEMDKAGKYIQPAHIAAIRDMSRILATIGPALQGVPEEIENVLRLYDGEIKEARED